MFVRCKSNILLMFWFQNVGLSNGVKTVIEVIDECYSSSRLGNKVNYSKKKKKSFFLQNLC